MADFLDEYVVRMGNPNSKEYKQALGRIEANKLRESEKQTKIMKEAEQQRINAMYDIARRDRLERERERIEEEEKYRYRRNQEIFDKIGFDYNIVDSIYTMLNYTEKKIDILNKLKENDELDVKYESDENINFFRNDDRYDKKEELEEKLEEESKGNEIINKYKESQKNETNIINKKEKDKKIIIWLQVVFSILATLVLAQSGNFLGLLSIIISYILIMIGLGINWIKLNKLGKIAFEEWLKSKNEYDELYEKYRNEKIEQVLNKYNKLINEFTEFRKVNYNKEIETALDLIGMTDINLLEESVGKITSYKIYFNEFRNKLRPIEEEIRAIPLS